MRKVIGTHSGSFHADEVLACALLRKLPRFSDAVVMRTRDAGLLAQCDVVVDVGAIYDAATLRFDHHQRGFDSTFSSRFSIKLSSAGLVYKHFGMKWLEEVLRLHRGLQVEEEEKEAVYLKLYEDFFLGIDAVDNGVEQFEGGICRYKQVTDLSSRIARLNPSWTSECSDSERDERFARALEMAEAEVLDVLRGMIESWLPARKLTRSAYASRYDSHSSGQILVLKQFFPWRSELLAVEAELGCPPEDQRVLYVVFPDSSGQWRVQAVPESELKLFQSRKALPEPWRGVRDEELSRLAEIEGCVFVHASGFIGGHKTLEGALKMAEKALRWK